MISAAAAGGSGIHAFELKPRGATFEFARKPEQFVWSILATDCQFGPDGGFYLSDWVEGWGKTGKGRIYKIGDAQRAKDADVLLVKKLLAEGMSTRPAKELAMLLAHGDMRIRQEAQFELAARADAPTLTTLAEIGPNRLSRLHAIWGLGQIARKEQAVLRPLLDLTTDKDAEVRAQACKILGEHRVPAALSLLVDRLKDTEPRVRFFAAMSLGKLGKTAAMVPLLDMLRENADADAYLRHAGVMALAGGVGDRNSLIACGRDPLPAVRLVGLLAMRRLRHA